MALNVVVQGLRLEPGLSKGPRVLGKANKDENAAISVGVHDRVL